MSLDKYKMGSLADKHAKLADEAGKPVKKVVKKEAKESKDVKKKK